jgi:hypothetical protein
MPVSRAQGFTLESSQGQHSEHLFRNPEMRDLVAGGSASIEPDPDDLNNLDFGGSWRVWTMHARI